MKKKQLKLPKDIQEWLDKKHKKTKDYEKEKTRKPYWKKLGQVFVEGGSLIIGECFDKKDFPRYPFEKDPYGIQIGVGDAVISSTGYGDGCYEIMAKIVECRVAEIRIKFI